MYVRTSSAVIVPAGRGEIMLIGMRLPGFGSSDNEAGFLWKEGKRERWNRMKQKENKWMKRQGEEEEEMMKMLEDEGGTIC